MARKVSPDTFSKLQKTIAAWPVAEREQLARDLMRDLPVGTLDDLGDMLKRQAYHAEIRSMSEDYRKRAIAGEFESREDLIDDIQETIDGHHDVIYTKCAMDVVCQSDNSGAYVDDFGSEGLIENGDVAWSRLAYSAMERDLIEQLRAEGIDVNDEPDEWKPDPIEEK